MTFCINDIKHTLYLVPLCLASQFIKCYAECRYAESRYAECRYAECRYAECRYAEWRYAECRSAKTNAPAYFASLSVTMKLFFVKFRCKFYKLFGVINAHSCVTLIKT
jgi:hypothetical protein